MKNTFHPVETSPGKLSIVATPIGNLEDITLRALNVLRSVDLVLCEDTRMTKRLLDRHSITTRTLSYHAHSKLSRTEEIIQLLKDGTASQDQGPEHRGLPLRSHTGYRSLNGEVG